MVNIINTKRSSKLSTKKLRELLITKWNEFFVII
uniref:Uncharacterized protein n=1 Tax=Lepeophtheirus salmonis TaxID=72036 RepID=A0A0K2UW00_LEPSM